MNVFLVLSLTMPLLSSCYSLVGGFICSNIIDYEFYLPPGESQSQLNNLAAKTLNDAAIIASIISGLPNEDNFFCLWSDIQTM
jgi:hypothetical protein